MQGRNEVIKRHRSKKSVVEIKSKNLIYLNYTFDIVREENVKALIIKYLYNFFIYQNENIKLNVHIYVYNRDLVSNFTAKEHIMDQSCSYLFLSQDSQRKVMMDQAGHSLFRTVSSPVDRNRKYRMAPPKILVARSTMIAWMEVRDANRKKEVHGGKRRKGAREDFFVAKRSRTALVCSSRTEIGGIGDRSEPQKSSGWDKRGASLQRHRWGNNSTRQRTLLPTWRWQKRPS